MTKLINDKGALNMQMYNEYQQKEREAFEAWLKSLNENGRTTYFLGQESTVAWEAWQAAKAIPDGFVLNKPAKVGSGTFGIGVKWSIVIGAAQRQFEYTQNDVGEKANIQNLKGILFDVPEGFVLVPKEPTQELLNKMQDFFVGAFENGLTGGQSIRCAYIAMIEAQVQANG